MLDSHVSSASKNGKMIIWDVGDFTFSQEDECISELIVRIEGEYSEDV